MSANEVSINGHRRMPSRAKRPRSAVTSGRLLFVDGDPNSAWSRRYHDLVLGHVNDMSAGEGPNMLSAAQLSLIRRCAAMEAELERLDSMLSRNEPIDLDSYARVSGHLRRLFETLGLERKPRDVGPTLGALLKADIDRQRREAAERECLAREEQQQ